MKCLIIATLLCTALIGHAHAACAYRTLTIHGTDRTELVCPPQVTAQSVPVLLVYHGRGGSAADMAEGSQFHRAWPEALVVYLEGLPGTPAPYDREGRYAGWQLAPGEMHDRDVEFTDATLEDLARSFSIDSRHVYATGHSNGSRFIGVLWAMRPDRFAGFAFSASQADRLITTAEPRPVFMGMGMRDELIPFEMQRHSIDAAVLRLGVGAIPTDHAGVTQRKNKDGMELMTFIHPDGHRWPSEQTLLIVDFFKRQIASDKSRSLPPL